MNSMIRIEDNVQVELPPKQARSQETLLKLLNALEILIKHQYFEHIKVSDICSEAGVSVGNFYRRFKSKESLLPLLYASHRARYLAWFESMVQQNKEPTLEKRIEKLIKEATTLFKANKHVLRTLYLHSRLNPVIIDNSDAESVYIYENLYDSWKDLLPNSDGRKFQKMFDFWGFTFYTILIENTIWDDVPPAARTRFSEKEFIQYSTKLLHDFLI